MRLVTVSVLGTALISAGMLAPATGEATATGQDGVAVEPGAVRPGGRIRISVPGRAGEVRVGGRLVWPDLVPTGR